jgi:hypothetical protein
MSQAMQNRLEQDDQRDDRILTVRYNASRQLATVMCTALYEIAQQVERMRKLIANEMDAHLLLCQKDPTANELATQVLQSAFDQDPVAALQLDYKGAVENANGAELLSSDEMEIAIDRVRKDFQRLIRHTAGTL